MTADHAAALARDALVTALLLSAPILVAGIVIGLAAGVFQAVTSIQDSTLPAALKLVGAGAITMLLLPWLSRVAVSYTYRSIVEIARLGPGAGG